MSHITLAQHVLDLSSAIDNLSLYEVSDFMTAEDKVYIEKCVSAVFHEDLVNLRKCKELLLDKMNELDELIKIKTLERDFVNVYDGEIPSKLGYYR